MYDPTHMRNHFHFALKMCDLFQKLYANFEVLLSKEWSTWKYAMVLSRGKWKIKSFCLKNWNVINFGVIDTKHWGGKPNNNKRYHCHTHWRLSPSELVCVEVVCNIGLRGERVVQNHHLDLLLKPPHSFWPNAKHKKGRNQVCIAVIAVKSS